MAAVETITTTIRMGTLLRAKIEAMAERDERNFSQQVQYMLKKYLEEHPEQDPDNQAKKGKRS